MLKKALIQIILMIMVNFSYSQVPVTQTIVYDSIQKIYYYPVSANNYKSDSFDIKTILLVIITTLFSASGFWIVLKQREISRSHKIQKEYDLKEKLINLEYSSDEKFRELISNSLVSNYLELSKTIIDELRAKINSINTQNDDIYDLLRQIYAQQDILLRELREINNSLKNVNIEKIQELCDIKSLKKE